MYLKCIDIIGFKSFAERTRIAVNPGITGVIGPNGCGKSNIVESIRWCIGEMSWKSLRSDSMVSVIFAGTARRNPVNLAEVTLTFDNARSQLPVQYSEVQVTRRIYRSGESEYHLNKTQCRLRDIRELFLDTGIGNDGYAIIDQGQVDFVLNAKPEDRRALFEEAAGVAKYKAKRQEALRKLDRVEIDLGRLQDSVSLINEQIKKLDADARKARLFTKYKTELGAMEAGHILREVAGIDGQVASEKERAAPFSEKLSGLLTGVEADEGRLAALNLERAGQESVAMESNQKIAAVKSEIGRLEERIANAVHSSRDLKAQLATSREDLRTEKSRAAEMDPGIERARQDHEGASARLDEARAEVDGFSGEYERLAAERDAAAADLAGLRKSLLEVVEESQNVSRRLSAAESRQGQLEYELLRTLKEAEKKSVQTDSARGEADRQERAATEQKSRIAEARQNALLLEAERDEFQGRLSALSEEALGLHADSARLGARIEALETQGAQDPYWVGAHAVVDAGIPGIVGTVRSLLDVGGTYRAFVEDALGERLYAVVCEDLPAARAGVEFLRGCGKGRARFLVADSLPASALPAVGAPGGARPLLELVRFAPEHERVIRHLLAETYALDGGLYGRYWVCGGTLEGDALRAGIADIGAVRKELAELEARRGALAGRKAGLEKDLAACEELLKDARASVSDESLKFHGLEVELNQKLESLRLYEEDVESLIAQAARVLADLAAVKEELIELRRSSDRGGEEAADLRRGEEDASKKHATLGEEVARMGAQREQFDSRLANIETQRNLLKERFDSLVENKEAIDLSIRRRVERQEQWEVRIKELAEVDSDSKRRLDEFNRDLAGLERESSTLFEKLQLVRKDAEALTHTVHEKKAEADELRETLHTSELRVSELATRRKFLVDRLLEEWKICEEDARLKYKDQPVDEARIQFLRRRIESLGNINMAAPEEYEELTKRRDRLQGQIDDLSQAKQDLRTVITKINSTTRENFRQTFHEVREHFRKLYGVLFEGGEADLVLTDQENLLETGIDIVAQPPGKRLQSISQLSGGEKALTAIALLFAFFMVKPAPICMLDEADAALDDANVDRFVSLLREFVDRTQFLIVSHNKKTMEACDAIYGITMEESGVSQIISVDFKKRPSGGEADAEREPVLVGAAVEASEAASVAPMAAVVPLPESSREGTSPPSGDEARTGPGGSGAASTGAAAPLVVSSEEGWSSPDSSEASAGPAVAGGPGDASGREDSGDGPAAPEPPLDTEGPSR
ncbi:MAG: chromosome segregation protein SMC [Elusimicrobiota bacterium]